MSDELDLDLDFEENRKTTPQTTPIIGTGVERDLDNEVKKATQPKPKKNKKGLRIALGVIGGAVAAGGIAAGVVLGLKSCAKTDIIECEKKELETTDLLIPAPYKLKINKKIDDNIIKVYAQQAAGSENPVEVVSGGNEDPEPTPVDIKIIDNKAEVGVIFSKSKTPQPDATATFTLVCNYKIDGKDETFKLEGCTLKYVQQIQPVTITSFEMEDTTGMAATLVQNEVKFPKDTWFEVETKFPEGEKTRLDEWTNFYFRNASKDGVKIEGIKDNLEIWLIEGKDETKLAPKTDYTITDFGFKLIKVFEDTQSYLKIKFQTKAEFEATTLYFGVSEPK